MKKRNKAARPVGRAIVLSADEIRAIGQWAFAQPDNCIIQDLWRRVELSAQIALPVAAGVSVTVSHARAVAKALHVKFETNGQIVGK